MLDVDLYTGVLTVYDADGFLGIGVDGIGETKAGLEPAEAIHPFGIMGRPRDPDTDASGVSTLGFTTLRLIEGNDSFVFALGDPRATTKLPQLAKGSSVHYADVGATHGGDDPPYVLLAGDTAVCTVHVPASIPSDAAGANIKIRLEHGAGPAIEVRNNKVRLEYAPAGPSVEVRSDVVELGGAGAKPVVIDNGSFAAWVTAVTSALAAAGHPVTAPTGFTATKATAL